VDIPEGYIKKKGSTVPFGYKISEDVEGYLEPIQTELDLLNKYIVSVQQEELSLREAAEALSLEADRKISHVGLSLFVKKNTFTPKRQYSKEKLRKQKLAREQKELEKAKKRLAYKESKIKNEQDVLKKATEQTKSHIVTEEQLEDVAPSLKESIKDSKVLFHPN